MANRLRLPSSNFHVRPATSADVPAMTDTFLHSFNAPFWQYFIPDTTFNRKWWDEAFQMGLDDPTVRSFVVTDSDANDRVVAFSRWVPPQKAGNLDRAWPELNEEDGWDMELVGAFFGGMAENRHKLMGSKPHWFLELLGVHDDYQKKGIGAMLVKWGTDHADSDGLDTYLDGSEIGQPFYKKHFGFKQGAAVQVPDKQPYGSFRYNSIVRPPAGK